MKRSDHEIVQEVLDGGMSRESFDGFQERMRADEDLVKLYGEYAVIHHSLYEEFEDEPIVTRPEPVVRKSLPARIAILAAAATVVLASWLLFRQSPREDKLPPLIATMRFSPDAVWHVDGVSRSGQGWVGMGKSATLQLVEGQASVALGDSASALLEAPAAFTVVSQEALHLAGGQGRFRIEKPDARLKVTTPTMTAEDLGTDFAVRVSKDLPDELHVFDGKVRMRVNGRSEGEILSKGEAGRIAGAQAIERFAAEPGRFPDKMAEFKTLVSTPFVKTDWRVEYGTPSFLDDRLEGENYAVFLKLPETAPARDGGHILLATMQVYSPPSGQFHTDGWAGMSFFSNGTEIVFFGDSYGPEHTWSLDVKQRMPVVLPGNPVVGPHTVTMRYDSSTGEVSLHEGKAPLSAAFCSGKLPAGTAFDEIRLGASSSAALAVGGVQIQSGGLKR